MVKRKAILLSHEDGELMSGKDVEDMRSFLVSPRGGGWFKDEIYSKKNIGLQELDQLCSSVRAEEFDFVLFYFSGHGGWLRNTVIELNRDGEQVSERCFSRLAMKQLNIFDCCRSYPVDESDKVASESPQESQDIMLEYARRKYDEKIIDAWPQSTSLYSCRKGEASYDFGQGGIYTQSLLTVARTAEEGVLFASQAHVRASELTIAETSSRLVNQHPDFFMAKYPLRYQLPFAINPKII